MANGSNRVGTLSGCGALAKHNATSLHEHPPAPRDEASRRSAFDRRPRRGGHRGDLPRSPRSSAPAHGRRRRLDPLWCDRRAVRARTVRLLADARHAERPIGPASGPPRFDRWSDHRLRVHDVHAKRLGAVGRARHRRRDRRERGRGHVLYRRPHGRGSPHALHRVREWCVRGRDHHRPGDRRTARQRRIATAFSGGGDPQRNESRLVAYFTLSEYASRRENIGRRPSQSIRRDTPDARRRSAAPTHRHLRPHRTDREPDRHALAALRTRSLSLERRHARRVARDTRAVPRRLFCISCRTAGDPTRRAPGDHRRHRLRQRRDDVDRHGRQWLGGVRGRAAVRSRIDRGAACSRRQ